MSPRRKSRRKGRGGKRRSQRQHRGDEGAAAEKSLRAD